MDTKRSMYLDILVLEPPVVARGTDLSLMLR